MPAVKVSVVVPVYNPGSDIDDCISSLVTGQSLPTSEYEVIFVDDGSTDDTPARLDALAAEHDHVRVIHIPNSGWPGKPRNVGTDAATGEYVYYVDNDDYLGPEALERLAATAAADDADVVIGKVVTNGKQVPRVLFAKNRHGINLERSPFLITLLTPHKLFRRAFLQQHDIRFPEGRRRLEDHVFVVHAYLHTDRISVLADYPCYYWMVRGDKTNASIARFDPVAYYGNVREVLDIVESHTPPGEFRERVLSHWYRGKMLKRVRGSNFLRHDPEYRTEIYDAIRTLSLERYGDWVHEHLRFALRMRSYLLRHADEPAIAALAEFERQLNPAAVGLIREEGDGLRLKVQARMEGEVPLRFERVDDRVWWLPPASLEGRFPDAVREITADIDDNTVQVQLRSQADGAKFLLPAEPVTKLKKTEDGGREAVATVRIDVDPATAAAGAPLSPGVWDVTALVDIAGFYGSATVRGPKGRPLRLAVGEDGTIRQHRKAAADDDRDSDNGASGTAATAAEAVADSARGLLRKAAEVLGGS